SSLNQVRMDSSLREGTWRPAWSLLQRALSRVPLLDEPMEIHRMPTKPRSAQSSEEAHNHAAPGGPVLQPCSTCGNSYDKSFRIEHQGNLHTFDCFECAIQLLAPQCKRCGCRVIGHGVESEGEFYCCAHCARALGVIGARDRADYRAS